MSYYNASTFNVERSSSLSYSMFSHTLRCVLSCTNVLVGSGRSSILTLGASFSPTGNLVATDSGDTNVCLRDLPVHTETPSHASVGHIGLTLYVEWNLLGRTPAFSGLYLHFQTLNSEKGTKKTLAHLTDHQWLGKIMTTLVNLIYAWGMDLKMLVNASNLKDVTSKQVNCQFGTLS